MALQIINDPNRTVMGQTRQSLAEGLGSLLNEYTQKKLASNEQKKMAQQFQQLGFEPEQAKGIAGLPSDLQKTFLSEQAKAAQTQKAAQSKEELQAIKESEKYVSEINSKYRTAKDSDKRLDRMIQLIDKGSLPNSTAYRLFKGMSEAEGSALSAGALGGIAGIATANPGIGLLAAGAGLLGPKLANVLGEAGLSFQKNISSRDLEEFEKLSNSFISDAKGIFGSRLTDADLNAFLATVPTLSQTDAGKRKIIDNMKSFNEASRIRYEAMKRILRANNGKRPRNLEILIEEVAGPELDRLANQFKVSERNAFF